MTTKIEWAKHTWNPIIGCSPESEGCLRCYAATFAKRLAGMGIDGYRDVCRWDGTTRLIEKRLDEATKWVNSKPRRIFVGSMTDLFHPSTPFEWIDRIRMLNCSQHTYLYLTKRPERMAEYFGTTRRPWPNEWLGVSAENQRRADERVPVLLGIPHVSIRFVSYEPALGPIVFKRGWLGCSSTSIHADTSRLVHAGKSPIDWIIAGAERGSIKRIARIEWFQSARDQCAAAGVPFFFKRTSTGRRELDGVRHEATP